MQNILTKHLTYLKDAIPDIVVELTVEARNFFDKSWENQGFTDKTLTPWKPSFERDGSKKEKTLVETGILRRSLRTETNSAEGTVFTEIQYAKIHNEGGTIKAEQSVKSFSRKRKGKQHTVKAHTRSVNTLIPQRKFMGPSSELNKISEGIILAKLDSVFRKR